MGIILSTTQYAPLAFVSAIIGFVSFAFTVGTFLKVVWINLTTMSEAPHEVHSYLTNLRTELLEEKASIRVMRKECRRWHRAIRKDKDGANSYLASMSLGMELDEVSLKTMGDTIKHLIKKFRDLEKPFLEEGSDTITDWKDHRRHRRRDTSSVSPYYEHSAYAQAEKGRARSRTDHDRGRNRDEEEQEEDLYWAQRTTYASFNFKRRLIWIRKKTDAQQLFETLSRVQIRRIALQVGGMSVLMHEYGKTTLQMEETLRRIDDRTGRIVGVRRVD